MVVCCKQCETYSPDERALSRAVVRYQRGLMAGGGGTLELRISRGKAPVIAKLHREVMEVLTLSAAERAMV